MYLHNSILPEHLEKKNQKKKPLLYVLFAVFLMEYYIISFYVFFINSCLKLEQFLFEPFVWFSKELIEYFLVSPYMQHYIIWMMTGIVNGLLFILPSCWVFFLKAEHFNCLVNCTQTYTPVFFSCMEATHQSD